MVSSPHGLLLRDKRRGLGREPDPKALQIYQGDRGGIQPRKTLPRAAVEGIRELHRGGC